MREVYPFLARLIYISSSKNISIIFNKFISLFWELRTKIWTAEKSGSNHWNIFHITEISD